MAVTKVDEDLLNLTQLDARYLGGSATLPDGVEAGATTADGRFQITAQAISGELIDFYNVDDELVGRVATTSTGQMEFIVFDKTSSTVRADLTGEYGLILAEYSSAPGTPSSGKTYTYPKTNKRLYFKDDAGTEYDLTGDTTIDLGRYGDSDLTYPPTYSYIGPTAYHHFDTNDILYISKKIPTGFTGTWTFNGTFFMDTAIASNASIEVSVSAITPGDSTAIGSRTFDTANASAATAVPGTVQHEFEISVTLTNNDSAAPGDDVVFKIERTDALAGLMGLVCCSIERS